MTRSKLERVSSVFLEKCGGVKRSTSKCHSHLVAKNATFFQEADLRNNCPDDVLGHVPANVETEVGEVEVGSVSSACTDHGGSWSGSGKGVCTFNVKF